MTSDPAPDKPDIKPQPTALPITRDDVTISDEIAMKALHHILNQYGDWDGSTFDEIEAVVLATGRRLVKAEPITAKVAYDDWDWPIARIETRRLTVFVRQAPDGGMCVDLFPPDTAAREALRVLINGDVVYGLPLETPVPADAGAVVMTHATITRTRAATSTLLQTPAKGKDSTPS